MKLNEEDKNLIIKSLIMALPVLRAQLNLTQEDLAKTIGVTRQTIINIESKKTKLTWSMTLALLFIFITNPMSLKLMTALGVLNKQILSLLGFDGILPTTKDKHK